MSEIQQLMSELSEVKEQLNRLEPNVKVMEVEIGDWPALIKGLQTLLSWGFDKLADMPDTEDWQQQYREICYVNEWLNAMLSLLEEK